MQNILDHFIDTISNNKTYLVLTSALLGALILPFIKFIFRYLGDYLKKLILKINKNKHFFNKYITWVINSNSYISLLPSNFSAAKSDPLQLMEISEIYISLSVSRKSGLHKPQAPEYVIDKYTKSIILGDPGAGKSTMMQYITLQCASNFQKTNIPNKYPRKIPILVRLNKFSDIASWPPNKDLLTAIKSDIENESTLSIPKSFFENLLINKQCILLLDAFDELSSAKARKLIAEKVKNLISLYPDNQIVITSRIAGFKNYLANSGFSYQFTIQKLTIPHIQSFIGCWYENLIEQQFSESTDEKRTFFINNYKKQGEKLIEAIKDNERIRQLAVNPMLLSLITLVHHVKVKLPKQRHLLYRDCVEILVERWDFTKELENTILNRLTIKEKQQILQSIAIYLQEQNKKSITKDILINNILNKACTEICGEKISKIEIEELLDVFKERTGLLIEKGFNENGEIEISFSHLTFQEYFTALELFKRYENNENDIFEYILEKIDLDLNSWQEVGLLALSHFSNPIHYQEILAKKILNEKNNSHP
jgi:predicted NACHT family NTPase